MLRNITIFVAKILNLLLKLLRSKVLKKNYLQVNFVGYFAMITII